jgi:hypothetical protein
LLCQHLATPLKDAVEGDEGGLGGHYPLGHLRRGVIIPWVNFSVTGNGGTLLKVIPEGAPHCQHLATPLKDAVEGDEGGLGGHYPLGHLRRGVIIPWVNFSVTGNGGPCQR